MNKNPIQSHRIGASGCDGSMMGFLNSRETRFKYSSGRGADFLSIYRLLSSLAIGNENVEALKELNTLVGRLENISKHAVEDLDEAELSMRTIRHAIEKVDANINELLAPQTHNS